MAEVLIALTVFAVTMTGVAKMVATGIAATVDSEARLVAYNLAREGVEAIANIVDSNRVRFPENIEECWDNLNAQSEEECENTTLGRPDGVAYIVSLELEDLEALFKWQAWEVTEGVDDGLYLVSIGNGNDQLYADQPKNENTVYEPSIYSRTVNVEKDTNSTFLIMTSTVTWEWNGQTKAISFKDRLKPY